LELCNFAHAHLQLTRRDGSRIGDFPIFALECAACGHAWPIKQAEAPNGVAFVRLREEASEDECMNGHADLTPGCWYCDLDA